MKEALRIGLVSLALSGCVAPVPENTKAYTTIDGIHYLDPQAENDPAIVRHEETHNSRADNYPGGRLIYFWRYATDQKFACEEEVEANKAEGLKDPTDHPACEGIIFENVK
jgi:hypothetical protein